MIFTGNKGRKPDKISLSKEFFKGADIDIEVKAKVIYESNTDDIIKTRKINDSLFSRKDNEIDIFDDIGEIIQLNYSASGLSGMEYLLEQRKADINTDENCILRFAQLIIEDFAR